MKTISNEAIRDFKIQIIENKKRYITHVMKFRKKILEEKARLIKLRKKKLQ